MRGSKVHDNMSCKFMTRFTFSGDLTIPATGRSKILRFVMPSRAIQAKVGNASLVSSDDPIP